MMNHERTYIIGDVHGCLGMLKRLMGVIDWRPDRDRLIFVGDYIDRGENPKGVIDYILGLIAVSEKVTCLMGNHEDMLLKFLDTGDNWSLLMNGGETTLRSYGLSTRVDEKPEIPGDHLSFFRNLRLWLEMDDYYVVHAGFRPGVEIRDQDRQDLIWIREPFIYSDHDFGKRVIFGHTPLPQPLVMENKIGIDTGAVYGNKLTCLELPSLKFHSVEA